MARLRHLVVVLPGIGGSVLEEPGPQAGRARPWYDLTGAALAKLVVAAELLDIDQFPDLVPARLVRDFTVLAPLSTLPGYQRLRPHLNNFFRDPHAAPVVETYVHEGQRVHSETDVLLVPYDFRKSITVAARRLDAAVRAALKARPRPGLDRPVVVIAHSMGGLVARHWVAMGEGWKHCQTLITLGTPYRGAPKALDWLVNGAGRPLCFRSCTASSYRTSSVSSVSRCPANRSMTIDLRGNDTNGRARSTALWSRHSRTASRRRFRNARLSC